MKTVDDYWFFKEKPIQKDCAWVSEYIELDNLLEEKVFPSLSLERDRDVRCKYIDNLRERVRAKVLESGRSDIQLYDYSVWHLLIRSTPPPYLRMGDLDEDLSVRAMVKADIDALAEDLMLKIRSY